MRPPGSLSFTIEGDDMAALAKWLLEHECPLRGRPLESMTEAIGEGPTYSFTPTSIGEMRNVKCPCGAVLDLSGDL